MKCCGFLYPNMFNFRTFSWNPKSEGKLFFCRKVLDYHSVTLLPLTPPPPVLTRYSTPPLPTGHNYIPTEVAGQGCIQPRPWSGFVGTLLVGGGGTQILAKSDLSSASLYSLMTPNKIFTFIFHFSLRKCVL